MTWVFEKYWNIVNEDGNDIYISKVSDLKIKIVEENEDDVFYINYKGYNVTSIMLIWDFEQYIRISSIDDLQVIGNSPADKCFVVSKKYKENLVDEIYFFLEDNNLDSCLKPEYKVNW